MNSHSAETPWALDARKTEQLRQELEQLAKSYTPQWHLDYENPDIGTTLAIIFANQMEGSIVRMNQMLSRYQTEFVNLLGLSLGAANPASGLVTLSTINQAIDGAPLPSGSRLAGNGIPFETQGDVYITSAQVAHVVEIDPTQGRITPLYHGPKGVVLPMAPEDVPKQGGDALQFTLFDPDSPGVDCHGLMLYHHSVFAVGEAGSISIRLPQVSALDPVPEYGDLEKFTYSYYNGTAFVPFTGVAVGEDGYTITLQGGGDSVPLVGNDGSQDGAYAIWMTCAGDELGRGITVKTVEIASSCPQDGVEFVACNDQEKSPAHFMPFGETASPFDECVIGHDKVFCQAGAQITLSFDLSFQEKYISLNQLQVAEELKIIKPRQTAPIYETLHCCVDEMVFEYYNGTGWRRLQSLVGWSNLFAQQDHAGTHSVTFRCPTDWEPQSHGGYQGRTLRLRLLRADNAYSQPCIHTMPVLDNLSLFYAYDQGWTGPSKATMVTGTKTVDITKSFVRGAPVTLFPPLPYGQRMVCFGFDRPLTGSPISMLFQVEEYYQRPWETMDLRYSTIHGFQSLKVADGTQGLSRTGTLLFAPPADFAPMELEGITAYWIAMVDTQDAFNAQTHTRPHIHDIQMNGVDIRNTQTLPVQTFTMVVPKANLRFPLGVEHILSAQVFVNEFGAHSQPEMERMMETMGEDVEVVRDFMGQIRSFFVKWSEVENFDHSVRGDRHYCLDRQQSCICFGDGVHCAIPTYTQGVAFTVQLKCCAGEAGNLPEGTVTQLIDQQIYLDKISNPIPTYGGHNMETIEAAHVRGANLVNHRGRLVTLGDYEREIRGFSEQIAQVRGCGGVDKYGNDCPNHITLALMMADYTQGSRSFCAIVPKLKAHLLAHSQVTVGEENLTLSEPFYMAFTVELWVEIEDLRRSSQVRQEIFDHIHGFFDPSEEENAWPIGSLPTHGEISMMLGALGHQYHIRHYVVTVSYQDEQGQHRVDMEKIPQNPFVMVTNGNHCVHVDWKGGQ
ncbi:hypothetical protein RFF05_09805 [Bengtsoniella intestinalis]|uniref:hypothetical protein n=1 Tax=Bengtsoniella intestinalis TaxID=3073143 RepID=UPI00391F7E43